jgi:hypothetical protein
VLHSSKRTTTEGLSEFRPSTDRREGSGVSVLTDLRNRGVKDVFFVVCDGLKGLPEVVINIWPAAIVQTCIIHLIRNTFRLASKRDWDALRRAVKPIYTAVNAAAAREAFDQLAETRVQRYPAIVRLGTTPGRSSSRSSTTTSRSAACSRPPTRSSHSTPATDARSRRADTSHPSRPPSSDAPTVNSVVRW